MKELALVDNNDESFEFSDIGEGLSATNYDFCLVGTFVTDKPYNFMESWL